jgi:hypothetical protein
VWRSAGSTPLKGGAGAYDLERILHGSCDAGVRACARSNEERVSRSQVADDQAAQQLNDGHICEQTCARESRSVRR